MAATEPRSYTVTDDAGLIGLLDPDAYAGFVDRDWTLPQLLAHLRTQMRERRLLLWGSGREDVWRVRVEVGTTPPRGFRTVTGPIVSTCGRLLLTDWTALTMSASYEDVPLPEPHDEVLLLTVAPGAYRCTVVQLQDPEPYDVVRSDPDFVVALTQDDESEAPWAEFPWSTL